MARAVVRTDPEVPQRPGCEFLVQHPRRPDELFYIQFITIPSEEWPTAPESKDLAYGTLQIGDQVIAFRTMF